MKALYLLPSLLSLLVKASPESSAPLDQLGLLRSHFEGVGAWNPDWNYLKGGDDWNFTNCNNSKQQQAPINFNETNINWWKPVKAIQYSFLPSYQPAVPKKDVFNSTFTVFGDFGSVLATEPTDYS